MLDTPFPPWPSFTGEEGDAVRRTLLSNRVNYWTGGECRLFEQEFAAWCGCRHAVAVANGTLALEASLRALGIGPGDEVVVTPRTFIASASCIVAVGATPVFADVDRDSQNITAETVAAVLSPASKAVVCVHLAGMPCDMDPIMRLADERGLFVVEDCAQAHGARYKGRPVGSIGHIAAWSFCQDKIMTTGGEGGMVTTSDALLWKAAWSYKDHGKSWDGVYQKEHPPGFRWLHESFGSNWRMLEMQAAVGRIQLRRMAEWTAARRPTWSGSAGRQDPSRGYGFRRSPSGLSMRPTSAICFWSRSVCGRGGRVSGSWRRSTLEAFPVTRAPVRKSIVKRRSREAGSVRTGGWQWQRCSARPPLCSSSIRPLMRGILSSPVPSFGT